MTRKSIFALSALALALTLTFAATFSASAGDFQLSFGSVQGQISLPSTLPQGLSSLPCSSLKVGLYRYTQGDPIGTQTGPSVTPQPAGPGKCSYKLTALATDWQVSVGDTLANWDLSYQVSPQAGVMIQKGQTATRNIAITQVKPASQIE